jgi:hypothetical protein
VPLLTSEDEQRRALAALAKARGSGVLKAVASVPFAVVRGAVGLVRGAVADPLSPKSGGAAADGLADQWIDFLIEQVRAHRSVCL